MVRRIKSRKFEARFNESEKGMEVLEILHQEINDRIRGGGDEEYFFVQMRAEYKDIDQIEIYSFDNLVRVDLMNGKVAELPCNILHLSLREKPETIATKIVQLCELLSE